MPRRRTGALTTDLRLIYTAADEIAAEAGLEAFEQHWGQRYPAIVRLWRFTYGVGHLFGTAIG